MKILVFSDYFLPAYKAGGPINTLENLVRHVNNDFHFFTRDRDLGDKKAFKGVNANTWVVYKGFNVFYSSANILNSTKIIHVIKSKNIDLIYLNSFFSFNYSMLIILLKYIGILKTPILLAPKGEFSPGFLQQKDKKKSLFIFFSKLIKLYKNIYWHASTEMEKNNIIKRYPEYSDNIYVAEDITTTLSRSGVKIRTAKHSRDLKVCFISRIHQMKNILYTIKILGTLPKRINIQYDIYGPVHDRSYWEICLNELGLLPENIKWEYKGPVPRVHIFDVFQRYHLFFLPTFGENYGHIILEALSAGCAVLISDNTPWNDINNEMVGRAVPLASTGQYYEYIEHLYYMDDKDYKVISTAAVQYASKRMSSSNKIKQNIQLFKKIEGMIN